MVFLVLLERSLSILQSWTGLSQLKVALGTSDKARFVLRLQIQSLCNTMNHIEIQLYSRLFI
jgi:hypothetical protein